MIDEVCYICGEEMLPTDLVVRDDLAEEYVHRECFVEYHSSVTEADRNKVDSEIAAEIAAEKAAYERAPITHPLFSKEA